MSKRKRFRVITNTRKYLTEFQSWTVIEGAVPKGPWLAVDQVWCYCSHEERATEICRLLNEAEKEKK